MRLLYGILGYCLGVTITIIAVNSNEYNVDKNIVKYLSYNTCYYVENKHGTRISKIELECSIHSNRVLSNFIKVSEGEK